MLPALITLICFFSNSEPRAGEDMLSTIRQRMGDVRNQFPRVNNTETCEEDSRVGTEAGGGEAT